MRLLLEGVGCDLLQVWFDHEDPVDEVEQPHEQRIDLGVSPGLIRLVVLQGVNEGDQELLELFPVLLAFLGLVVIPLLVGLLEELLDKGEVLFKVNAGAFGGWDVGEQHVENFEVVLHDPRPVIRLAEDIEGVRELLSDVPALLVEEPVQQERIKLDLVLAKKELVCLLLGVQQSRKQDLK